MPRSQGFYSGDGVTVPLIQGNIQLPDAGGTSVTLEGSIVPVGGVLTPITGSPLTGPVIPGAGSTYWIIQVDNTTGAATIKTSSSAYPAADPTATLLFNEQIQSTDTALDTATAFATPDER